MIFTGDTAGPGRRQQMGQVTVLDAHTCALETTTFLPLAPYGHNASSRSITSLAAKVSCGRFDRKYRLSL